MDATPDRPADAERPRILITGATGYVGGRLLRSFEADGIPVVCMLRRPRALRHAAPTTSTVIADVLEPERLNEALRGVDVAYYLVHSMGSKGNFRDDDRRAAANFARAAVQQGVDRVIYLGGLGHGDDLSDHLASRHQTGAELAARIPTTEFRAGIIIGSGSLSFESISALVQRLPVMIAPRWVATRTQPIAIDDVIAYLRAAVDLTRPAGVYEIGGPDVMTYRTLMLETARQQGLRRRIIGVPLLTPHLSSLWLGLVTPVYARVAKKMIDGLRNETVVNSNAARDAFPEIAPMSAEVAIGRALADGDAPPTRWSDAFSSYRPFRTGSGRPLRRQRVDSRIVEVSVDPASAFAPIQRIGGSSGWYAGDFLWSLRGLVDSLVGGVGLRRGRHNPVELAIGDTVDFWRVDAFEQDRLLRLRAEMRLPGRAWLQWRVEPTATGAMIRQTAFYEPSGLFGHLYWIAVSPLHTHIFRGMLRSIANQAEDQGSPPATGWGGPTT
ncbi:MAG: SDR family oxidoreductase [Actinobacteria bacterium]|nr:SDR family oxidoreductase [Actinomycetota bacterium]